jgi:hypothetical protein
MRHGIFEGGMFPKREGGRRRSWCLTCGGARKLVGTPCMIGIQSSFSGYLNKDCSIGIVFSHLPLTPLSHMPLPGGKRDDIVVPGYHSIKPCTWLSSATSLALVPQVTKTQSAVLSATVAFVRNCSKLHARHQAMAPRNSSRDLRRLLDRSSSPFP